MNRMYDAIAALCQERGINVTQLCRALDIPRSTLSELSTGRTKQLGLRHATRIAEYFGVPVAALTGEEPDAGAALPDPATTDIRDEPIAAYENLKRYLTEDDKADIATLIRLRAEINRGRRP